MLGHTAENLLEYLSSDSVIALPRPKEASEAIQEILSILVEPRRSGGLTYNLYFGDQPGLFMKAVFLLKRDRAL